MRLKRFKLFYTKEEFLSFISILFILLFYSTLIHYQAYKNFTRFNSIDIDVVVLKAYKKDKKHTILKLKTDDKVIFYTKTKQHINNPFSKKLTLRIYIKKLSFYKYLTTFYAPSKILKIKELDTLKQKLNSFIASQHTNKDITSIYQALFSAKTLTPELQKTFSYLGISHLFAISGFHLSVLSLFIFLSLKPLYSFFQNRFFPYRHIKIDLFIVTITILFTYIIFLDAPPSLIRSFGMLVIGFILYDRGAKVISMQTLLITIAILICLDIKLLLSIGFWLSVAGVFYIFLFFMLFENLSKIKKFFLLPIWVYITMLPYSLAIFGNFSLYHPLSIIWTTLFSLFYPLSIILHLVGYGNILDGLLENLLTLDKNHIDILLEKWWLYLYIMLSILLSAFKNWGNHQIQTLH